MMAPSRRLVRAATLALTFAMLRAGGAVSAQTQTASPADMDRTELAAIVMSSVAEVQLCRLADEKTKTADIRAFCRKVANDGAHAAIDGLTLAKRLGATEITLHPTPGTAQIIEGLTQYEGHEFDRAFLLQQIEDREHDQDAIRYAAEVSGDGSVKRFENRVLPSVENDLELAETTLRTITHDTP